MESLVQKLENRNNKQTDIWYSLRRGSPKKPVQSRIIFLFGGFDVEEKCGFDAEKSAFLSKTSWTSIDRYI
uniref:Uncharacterized protein n=1 Tax=Romanomermis culicivorax TaxID=13658 RepID=A0A915HSV8_ROMCU